MGLFKIWSIKERLVPEAFLDWPVIHVTGDGTDRPDIFWTEYASSVGELVPMEEDQQTGNKTGSFWVDIRYDANYPTQFIHSNTRQPLHTDGSYEAAAPEISFFYCKTAAEIGGATTFLDPAILEACLAEERPELLEQLKQPLRFSKGDDYKVAPVMQDGICNWNYFRAEPSPVREEFHKYLEERILNMGVVLDVMLKPGDAVFFLDSRVLHGRNAFIGPRWLRKGGVKWAMSS